MSHTAIKFLAVALFAFAGCAPSTAYQKDSSKGFCFKAEGLRTARCFAEYASCERRENSLRAFATIQSECQLDSPGMLSAESVETTMAGER